MSSFREKLSGLPCQPGVYLFRGRSGEILYIGKAKSLKKRVSSYFTKPPDLKTSILLDKLRDIDYILAKSELDALLLENELIKKHKPRYNVALRDDKTYPFLKLSVQEEWPRLFLARKKTKDGARYFGRFQGGMVREVIRQVKKLFPIRWCKETPLKKRAQPCLYYRIGKCSGPCIGAIEHENYLALISGVQSLLAGNLGAALAKLEKEMQSAAGRHEFELAAILRDRIRLLGKMLKTKGPRHLPELRNEAGLKELKEALALGSLPTRIEGFDISNIQGSNIVGSMVTFYGGVPLKSAYRKFKIRSVAGKPNDVAAIYEIIKRRFSGGLSQSLPAPDLILIDGGLGQVNSA
ncbi:MAG: excinuclease ABC subunit UvrC, partial [bacterium]